MDNIKPHHKRIEFYTRQTGEHITVCNMSNYSNSIPQATFIAMARYQLFQYQQADIGILIVSTV